MAQLKRHVLDNSGPTGLCKVALREVASRTSKRVARLREMVREPGLPLELRQYAERWIGRVLAMHTGRAILRSYGLSRSPSPQVGPDLLQPNLEGGSVPISYRTTSKGTVAFAGLPVRCPRRVRSGALPRTAACAGIRHHPGNIY